MHIKFVTTDPTIRNNVMEFIDEWNSTHPCIKTKTSGSTGTPKEVLLDKKHMMASAKATGKFLNLKAGNTALLCLSPNTIAGKMMIVRSIVLELDLHVGAVSSRPLHLLEEGFDFIAMVPMQLQQSIEKDSEILNKSKQIIVGGGPVSATLQEHVLQLKPEVFHTYGMTETISHIALRNLSQKEDAFQALPGISFKEKNGQLVINAPHVGANNLHTNDQVLLHTPSAFTWLGRSDFVINSGGFKIQPEALEHKLAPFIAAPFFVSGIDDDYLGSKVVLCVESEVHLELKKSAFSEVLEAHEMPKIAYYFDAFVHTESKKINRIATLEKRTSAQKSVL
ncbi:AMP-binding protein [Crocinitomicaceae bacterium]|nr:AMP-binding protein [Crocinitomicaceae bacterium]